MIISIRAPARGATLPGLNDPVSRQISIRAPARGATKTTGADRPEPINFNPRSREGSDHPILDSLYLCFYFNPRSREGSDSTQYNQ